LLHSLRPRIQVPYRRKVIEQLREMKRTVDNDIQRRLVDQHVSITTDGWTSSNNDTYMSFTCSFITSDFKLEALTLECRKHEGNTAGEDLAAAVRAMIERHGLKGRVLALTTDCEPSMVKTGRILAEGDGPTHIGCACHRLESVTSKAFNGPGVSKALALARGLVARYTMSSQACDRLKQMCEICEITSLKPIQDVVTKFWSTHAFVVRLLYLRRPIAEHERIDRIPPMLEEKDWEVLVLVEPLLKPFMEAQKHLEASKTVTGSLVIGYIADLRDDLDAAVINLKSTFGAAAGTAKASAKADVLRCAEALKADFGHRWGNGTDVLTEMEGPRRQPKAFKKLQVLSTAMDPRSKSLYGIDEMDHPEVWDAVAAAAVEIGLAAESAPTDVGGGSGAPIAVDSAPIAVASAHRPHRRGFAAAAAAHAQVGGAVTEPTGSKRQMESIVNRELEAFKTTPGIDMSKIGKDGKLVLGDPLQWWGIKAREYPMLAALARRVLCIPASQAQSERVFSAAGQIVSPTRSRLDPEHVELMVFLRTVMPEVDKWNGKGKKRKA
ncbi:unnamed protein product, partial [Hapterophycus canaliculatus]